MKSNDEPKVWVTISETINTGNYQSVKIEAGYSKMYKEKENPKDILSDGIDELQKLVSKKAKKISKSRKE